jgi:hypothetical protein
MKYFSDMAKVVLGVLNEKTSILSNGYRGSLSPGGGGQVVGA